MSWPQQRGFSQHVGLSQGVHKAPPPPPPQHTPLPFFILQFSGQFSGQCQTQLASSAPALLLISPRCMNATPFTKLNSVHRHCFSPTEHSAVRKGYCNPESRNHCQVHECNCSFKCWQQWTLPVHRGRLKRSARAVQLFGHLAVLETHTL